MIRPLRQRAHPARQPPFQTPVVGSGCYLYFSLTSYKMGSHNHFLGLDNMLEWLTKFRETVAYVCQVIRKAVIKDTDEKSDEKVHRARFQKDPERWSSVPVARRGAPLPARGSIHQYCHLSVTVILNTSGGSPNPVPWVFMEALLHRWWIKPLAIGDWFNPQSL